MAPHTRISTIQAGTTHTHTFCVVPPSFTPCESSTSPPAIGLCDFTAGGHHSEFVRTSTLDCVNSFLRIFFADRLATQPQSRSSPDSSTTSAAWRVTREVLGWLHPQIALPLECRVRIGAQRPRSCSHLQYNALLSNQANNRPLVDLIGEGMYAAVS